MDRFEGHNIDDIARRLEGAHAFERMNAPDIRRDRWREVAHWALVAGVLVATFVGGCALSDLALAAWKAQMGGS